MTTPNLPMVIEQAKEPQYKFSLLSPYSLRDDREIFYYDILLPMAMVVGSYLPMVKSTITGEMLHPPIKEVLNEHGELPTLEELIEKLRENKKDDLSN